jgi:Rieske 2Fe-2S family protein
MPDAIPAAAAPEVGLEGFTYWLPEHYERELERFWRPDWRFVCHLSEIAEPGAYVRYDLGRDSVIVVREADGGIGALHNVCRHRGAPLVTGERGRCSGRLVCPFHGWSFDLDGTVRVTPRMHAGFDRTGWDLKKAWVEVWNGFVFVCVGPDRPRPLAERLAGADFAGFDMDRLRVAWSRDDVVEANWKIAWEGGLECYHCPMAHPALLKAVPFDDYGDQLNAREVAEYDYIPDRNVYPEFQDDMSRRGIRRADNPNRCLTAMQWHLGVFELFVSHDGATAAVFRPLGPTRTAIRTIQLVPVDAVEGVDYDPARFAFVAQVRDEDNTLVELVQQGVGSSAFEPGPFNRDLEAANRAFTEVYRRTMA